ncbi:hypothetical protein GOM49_05765 [Clostridium bovifaecis]|uniref:GDYXXLXY domain-containing protein n=1 Tax=Clostridium bovifaecis TaxID=2184719 RepID=A0A6I6ELY9_9CLOT|nr:hypothetical protein GOM49_05765 [Clostridium bovifaecis]
MKRIFKKRGFKYLVAFLVPFTILIAMTIKPVITNALGEEILIKTKPFDPRDVFRGDYVQLDYEISEVPLEKLDKEISDMKDKNEDEYEDFTKLRKKDMYAVLKKDNDFYVIDKVTLKKPSKGIYLKGKYRYPIYKEQSKEEDNGKLEIRGIRVDYTLDKYFVPENTGKDLEKAAIKGELVGRIKVYNGYSLLKEVIPIE